MTKSVHQKVDFYMAYFKSFLKADMARKVSREDFAAFSPQRQSGRSLNSKPVYIVYKEF